MEETEVEKKDWRKGWGNIAEDNKKRKQLSEKVCKDIEEKNDGDAWENRHE